MHSQIKAKIVFLQLKVLVGEIKMRFGERKKERKKERDNGNCCCKCCCRSEGRPVLCLELATLVVGSKS